MRQTAQELESDIHERRGTQPRVRIAKLRAKLEKLGGTVTGPLESIPAEVEEEFLRHVLEYESAEPTSLLTWLANSGIEVPAPDQLDDKDSQSNYKRSFMEWRTLAHTYSIQIISQTVNCTSSFPII